MNRLMKLSLASGLMLAGCATAPAPQMTKIEAAPLLSGETPLCETSGAVIRTGYVTSRANKCDILEDGRIVLTILPEAFKDPEGQTINNSAWYGFRLVPKADGAVRVRLDYEGGSHRYDPKISRDGQNWDRLPPQSWREISDESVELTLEPGGAPLFVSAQEIFTHDAHNSWTKKLGARGDATVSDIGTSREGRPIKQIDIRSDVGEDKPYVVLVGRQHPPEVTGAYALIPFVETILDGSELSERFLDKFNLLVIPMINPDGVVAGNWRFNMGGMDLNRDWGPFTQPETQAVRSAFERFHSGADSVIFFLDFHSTQRNLLYTQADDEPTNPPMFTRDWIDAVAARLNDEDYPFTREARHNSGRPISKNYMYDSFGIPAITYEVGDETPRKEISKAASVFSEEMMKLLLEHTDES